MRFHIGLLGSGLPVFCGLFSLALSGCGTSQRAGGTAPGDAAVPSGGTAGTTVASITTGGTTAGGMTTGTGGASVAGGSVGGAVSAGGVSGGRSTSFGGTTSGGGSSLVTTKGGTATGGSTATAGKTATGGAGGLGTGGTGLGSGGSAGTGGTATAGRSGTGGVSTGGTANGGSTGSGGVTRTGGAGSGGSLARVCPDSGSYVGSSAWTDKMEVTAGATYCGHFKESRDLEKEYATKAKLTIARGSYALPNTAGTYSFALPVCFERRTGESIPVFAGAGQAKATPYTSTVNTFISNGVVSTQPISLDGSPGWIFSMRLSYFSWTGAPVPPVLDGSYLCHPSTGEVGDTRPGYLTYLELCQGTTCEDTWQDLRFEACNPDYPLYRHTVTFAGGEIVLDLRFTGGVGQSVMLAAFTAASGTLDGKAFTQNDYWKLVYSADHHHFKRNFAVLFDAPMGDACGLKVTNFWGNRESAPMPEVSTIKCDLTTIAARTVSSATIERP